jgi:DNA polymerase elongation subunit (family B)
MTRRIFVDIETLPPDEDMRTQIPPAMIRKLARQRRSDEADETCNEMLFRRLALCGEYGRVLTIGVIVECDGQIEHRGLLGRERQTSLFHLDEGRTLRAFWKLIKNFNTARDVVIGHNVLSFDLPFIVKRSLINRVQPTVQLSFARYRNQPIFDTMQAWAHWDSRQYLTLNDLAGVLRLGMTKTEGMDGGKVYEQFCQGCHEKIASYCLQDVELVRAVYYRMVQPEGPEPEG